jgi:mannose-6-phosphate isomerase-like protein (cupin superfamily)
MSHSGFSARTKAPWNHRLTAAGGLAILGAVGLLAGAAAGAQDAAKVDAKHYKVVFENDQVRVLHITYGPHEKGVMHSHPAGVVVFLNDLNGRFTMPGGKTQDVNVKAGAAQWSEPTTHQPENLGDKGFEVIQVELKAKPAVKK